VSSLNHSAIVILVVGLMFGSVANLFAQTTDENVPNILVIWGDDIGISNISQSNRGVTGYQTPNIDRTAREGISFNLTKVEQMIEDATRGR